MNKLFLLILLSILSYAFTAQAAQKCDLNKLKWTGIPFEKNGKYNPNCRPQILYSWVGDSETIDQKDHKWPFRRKRAIFFHRTPLATSIYGSFSYRVKLKPNVKYKLVDWTYGYSKCYFPEAEKRNTVYVNQDKNGFSEYVLCSPEPVESWSFGTQEHLNEMDREFKLLKRLGGYNVDGFLNPHSRKYNCESCFQKYTIHDARNDGSERTILNSINIMKNFVKSGKGRVYNLLNGRAYTTGPKAQEHFKTKLRLPFHK